MTSQAWSPEAADFELLVGESVDISNRSFEDLRAVEKKALAGDAEAIREYESWSAGVLRDLYEKLWTSKGAYNGVRLNSTQAAAIMPHEYWNTNTTRANAYVNGFIFRSYCYSMGLNPRFTGKNPSGKTVNHGDFSDSTGYWKTLIDRPMYRNDGTYRDQQAVNMSHFEKGMLTKEWAETHWGEYKIKEPSKTRAKQAADKFVQDTRVKEQGDLSFSLDDEAYLDAVNRNDMETAQRMVDEAAKKAGFPTRLLHGTQAFGFTKPNVANSDDGITFFATNAENTAKTYSSMPGKRRISEDANWDDVDAELAAHEDRVRDATYELADSISALAGYYGYADGVELHKQFSKVIDEYKQGRIDAAEADSQMYEIADEWIAHAYSSEDFYGQEFLDWQESDDGERLYTKVNQTIGVFMTSADFEMNSESSGNYDLYADISNLLEIDCNGG